MQIYHVFKQNFSYLRILELSTVVKVINSGQEPVNHSSLFVTWGSGIEYVD